MKSSQWRTAIGTLNFMIALAQHTYKDNLAEDIYKATNVPSRRLGMTRAGESQNSSHNQGLQDTCSIAPTAPPAF